MVGLGFEGGVGIKLGRSSLNIDGGLTGLIFPQTMVYSKFAGQCHLHTKNSGFIPIIKITITGCYTTFFPILIALHKLRCITGNSTEELINFVLFIYLQVTHLHHYLHTFTPLFTHIYTIIYTHLHHYLHTFTPLFTHIYTIIYTHLHRSNHVFSFLNQRLHLNYFSNKCKYYFTRENSILRITCLLSYIFMYNKQNEKRIF